MLFNKSKYLKSFDIRLRGKSRRRKSVSQQTAALARFEKLEDRQLLSGVMGTEGMGHSGALALVPADQASFVTAQSGDWSDAATWAGGEVPTENAQVHIAAGHTVVFDAVQEDRTEWVNLCRSLLVRVPAFTSANGFAEISLCRWAERKIVLARLHRRFSVTDDSPSAVRNRTKSSESPSVISRNCF